MSRHKQLLQRILGGRSDAGVRFDDLCGLLRNLGFTERIRGSHHIFRLPIRSQWMLADVGSNHR